MTDSLAGSKSMKGTWSGTASVSGTPLSYRIYNSSGVCHIQGSIPKDMTLSSKSFKQGQSITVSSFTITSGNA